MANDKGDNNHKTLMSYQIHMAGTSILERRYAISMWYAKHPWLVVWLLIRLAWNKDATSVWYASSHSISNLKTHLRPCRIISNTESITSPKMSLTEGTLIGFMLLLLWNIWSFPWRAVNLETNGFNMVGEPQQENKFTRKLN